MNRDNFGFNEGGDIGTFENFDFWSYWFPLGKLEADWEQADFIFFDEGRIHVHTVQTRRRSKEEKEAYYREAGAL
jgi:hypothetical protein